MPVPSTLSDLEKRRVRVIFLWQISTITLVLFDLEWPRPKWWGPSVSMVSGPPTCARTVWETATKFCMNIKRGVKQLFTCSTMCTNADAQSDCGIANLLAVNLCDSLSYVVDNSDLQCIYDAFRLECTNLLLPGTRVFNCCYCDTVLTLVTMSLRFACICHCGYISGILDAEDDITTSSDDTIYIGNNIYNSTQLNST